MGSWLASEPIPHLEFCHHVLKQLLGLRTVGLFEIIGNPNLDHNGLEVPANAWEKVGKGGTHVWPEQWGCLLSSY